jgi:HAE1 family hydrophobic/amphiphilic exporter-1
MKKLIALCARRPVGVLMVTLFITVIGLISLTKLKLDLYPKVDYPLFLISASYEGAGPEEIENLLTKPLEGAISAVPGVKRVTSTSTPGNCLIVAECNYGTNMDFTNLKIRERIDLIKRYLPAEVDDPVIFKFDISMMPIVFYGFSSDKGIPEATRLANDKVKNRLERIPGVASVRVMGGLEREIKISLSAAKMASYNISPAYLSQVLSGENINLPGGVIDTGRNELVLRTIGELESVEEVKSLQIRLPNGSVIPLREIADIQDSYHDLLQYSRINGANSILIMAMKESDANTVLVTREIRKVVKELEIEFKGQARFENVFEQAGYIEKSLSNVLSNALVGGFLAIFVLYFFLRSVRSTLVISLAIPISIVITFFAIYFSGMTLNLVSMGGLALGVGMLVDNAIVVLEVIHRYRQEGHSGLTAAIEGASEVGMAITASTLTTVVVFVPVLFVEGVTAQIFKELALTVSFSLLASLVVALTVVPTIAARMLALRLDKRAGQTDSVKSQYNLGKVEAVYRAGLEWAINHRFETVMIAAALFLLGIVPFFLGMKSDFTQTMGEKQYNINIELPLGTSLATTDTIAKQVEAFARRQPESGMVFSLIGSSTGMGLSSGGESEVALVAVQMKAGSKKSIDRAMEEARAFARTIPGATIRVERDSNDPSSLAGSNAPVVINIEGPDIATLQRLAAEVKEAVKSVPGTTEVQTSWQTGRPELHLRIDRQRANAYGVSAGSIASAVQTAFQGSTATRIRLAGEEYDIFLRLRPEERTAQTDLNRLYVISNTGVSVPLSEVASFIPMKGPNKITRENQTRQIQVTAQLFERDLGSVSREIQAKVDREIIVPSNYNISFSGKFKEMQDAFSSLILAFLLAAFLVYMVIAVQYENIFHPLAIMGTLPLALFGITWSLFLTGRPFDVPAFIGVIMLAGIVVNNAIVLVDYIETLRCRGMERREAILQAGPIRLRPVLMTTLTTILGLLPLALGIGEGSELNVSMATVMIGGLTFCTGLTLIIIPVVYSYLDDFGRWMQHLVFGKVDDTCEYRR